MMDQLAQGLELPTLNCTICRTGTCPSDNCWRLRGYQSNGYRYIKLCCLANQNTNGAVCGGCHEWLLHRLITQLLGIWKFRKDSLLAQLPKDVVVFILVERMLKPRIDMHMAAIHKIWPPVTTESLLRVEVPMDRIKIEEGPKPEPNEILWPWSSLGNK